jgi:hypothetical protein
VSAGKVKDERGKGKGGEALKKRRGIDSGCHVKNIAQYACPKP